MPKDDNKSAPLKYKFRNGLYIVLSFVTYLGVSKLIDHASDSSIINAVFSAFYWPISLAVIAAIILIVILSPIWVVFFLPYRLMPDGEPVFFMFGVCNAVLPAIPAFSGWVLWQYL